MLSQVSNQLPTTNSRDWWSTPVINSVIGLWKWSVAKIAFQIGGNPQGHDPDILILMLARVIFNKNGKVDGQS